MQLKITKRDILFLFIGLFIAFLVDALINLNENKHDFLDGYNSAIEKAEK